MKNYFFLLMGLLAGQSLMAQQLYISPSGNDMNPGTRSRPLASLYGAQAVLRQLKGGGKVTITLADGVYRLKQALVWTAADLGGHELVVTAAKGEQPVLSGGQALGKPRVAPDGTWIFELPAGMDAPGELYVNSRRAALARLPQGLGHILDVREVRNSTTQATQYIRIAADLRPAFAGVTDWSGAVVHLYHNWDNTVRRVQRYLPDSGLLVISGKPMVSWNPLNQLTRFYVDGLPDAAVPGEWALKGNSIVYRPLPGEQAGKCAAEVPVTSQLLLLKGVSRVTLRGLRFEMTGFRIPLGGIDPEQTAASAEAVIMADSVSRVCFTDCEVAHTGLAGIWLRKACRDNTVSRCYLHDLGASALKIGTPRAAAGDSLTARNRIDNNILRDGGKVFPCAAGIVIFQSPYNQVTHNEIADFRYSGISMGWTWGYGNSYSHHNLISYNHIHHLGFGELSDMGGIYNLGKAPGTVISHNTIHHIWSHTYGGWGIYTDEGSSDILIRDNLVYACRTGGFHQHYGENNRLFNNIFALAPESQLEATRVEKHLSFRFEHNIVYFSGGKLSGIKWDSVRLSNDHNLYWDTRGAALSFGKTGFKAWQQQGKDQHSLIADPGFRDAAHFDFRFKDNSIVRQIGFEPFDYTQAGVYGSTAWKKLALTPPQTLTEYEQKIQDL